jgi:hypothetical protein
MTVAALLEQCRTLGIFLSVGPSESLDWEADDDPPAELLAALAAHKAELLVLVARDRAPVPAPQTADATELTELADWFTATADRLPQEPFGLVPWRRSGWAVWVVNPARFYAALRTDLAAGPSSARARTGALAEDMRRLRALAEQRGEPTHDRSHP